MTGEASTKPSWLGDVSAVLTNYSPELVSRSVLVGTLKAMLANEAITTAIHPPRRSCAAPLYLGIRGTGARVI